MRPFLTAAWRNLLMINFEADPAVLKAYVPAHTELYVRPALQAKQAIQSGSEEEFIAEHYWGYTRVDEQTTGEYQVTHPQWDIHPVTGFDYHCSTRALYGAAFENMLQQAPRSALLAAGSDIAVMPGKKIRHNTL